MKFDIQLVIFDMDGTILDTLEDLKDALNYSLSVHHYPKRTLEEVRSFVGNGIYKLIEQSLPRNASKEEITRVVDTFTPYYQAHCKDKTKAYPQVPELITSIRQRGYRTAVISNKPDAAVRELCKVYFDGLFDYVAGAKEELPKKPAPDSVLSAITTLHLQKALYIGDSEVDIKTAKNAGLDCILVTWGFRDRDFLRKQGAEYLADTPKEILQMLS